MSNLVTKLQCLLKRIPAKVQITVLGAEFLTAVTVILYCERRGIGLVENLYFRNAYFNVSGRHLRILALTLQYGSGHLYHPFTSERRSRLQQFLLSRGIHHKLGNAIAVTQVNERHSSKFP